MIIIDNMQKYSFMEDVMRDLNAVGIKEDEFALERNLYELEKNEVETVDFIGNDGGEIFKNKFKEFQEIQKGCGYCLAVGEYWAEDGRNVVIQFCRMEEMYPNDFEGYVKLYHTNDQYEIGRITGKEYWNYIRLNVRVSKVKIQELVAWYKQHNNYH